MFRLLKKEKNTVNNFEKGFFKLMNNIVYEKAMGNLRERVKVRLVNNAKNYKKCARKPGFFLKKHLAKKFVAIHEIKPVLSPDKPIYVEFSILDLSKLLMYQFHYKYIGRKFHLQTQIV